MSRKLSLPLSGIATGIFVLIPALHAQTNNATILGDVTDPNGGVIAGAAITVRNMATGVSREIRTSDLGAYRVYPLNPGTYEVSASAAGFKKQIQPNVAIDAAANVKVNFNLEIGAVSETVEVQASATVLQTQDASVGGTVTSSEVERLPVNGRSTTSVAYRFWPF